MKTHEELFDDWIASKTELTFQEWLEERSYKKRVYRDILEYANRRTGINSTMLGQGRTWNEL